jgi:hypothetical protein
MADKKNDQNEQKHTEAQSESDSLERHVDELMDPKLPDPKPRRLAGAPDVPEIDIFKGAESPVAVVADKQEGKAQPDAADTDTPPAKQDDDEAADIEKITEDRSIDSPADDAVVDEIVSRESDELLTAHDAEISKAFVVSGQKPGLKERITDFFRAWWQNLWARYITIAVVVTSVLVAGILPASRYFALNAAGVRVRASLMALDSTTKLPLKNVAVTVSGQTVKTNQDGVARLHDLRLGTQTVTIHQLGFAKVTRTVTLGLGSNPLEDVELKAVGAQYTFKAVDYLTGKPVGSAEAASGDANAQADDKGRIVLTVGKTDAPKIEVTLKAAGYRDEKISIDPNTTQPTSMTMVIKRKEVFISKQSGKYDLYKIDIDGKNKQILLAATGNERDQIAVIPHATDNMVALVSSREDKRNQDGYLLDTLTLIDIDDGTKLTLDSSERIQIVDWIKNRLVYVKIKAGTSAGNAERYQLFSYDYTNTSRLQLASANYFTDIVSAKGVVYYTASNNYDGGKSLFGKINPDSTGKQTLLTTELWNILRSGYDDLSVAGTQGWYSYRLGEDSVRKLTQSPANTNETRFYLDAPDGKHALWTDARDGKGVLLLYDAATKKDRVLASQSGLSYPLRWLDNRTVVYHIVTSQESAAYVLSLDGGGPKKISDVTSTFGLGRWNYY